jgi:hypothetical protein
MSAATKVAFTEAELKQVFSGICATWQDIGHDVIACCNECGERVTNAVAIEGCIDGGYMDNHANRKEAMTLIRREIDRAGYTRVLNFIARKLRLI